MSKIKQVIKRNGKLQNFNSDKINQAIFGATLETYPDCSYKDFKEDISKLTKEIENKVYNEFGDSVFIEDIQNAIEDESSKYHDAAVYWNDMLIDFANITKTNSTAYMGTAIPAYAMSMATLISFGLILKHAEKAKEAEDQNI